MAGPAADLTKGDFDGHPFRGNQWTEEGGGFEKEKTGVDAIDNAYDFVRDKKNVQLPLKIENGIDGGPAQSILFHGTTTKGLQSLTSEHGDVYITPQPEEAEGYARDMHRFGSNAKPGEVLMVRRKPGKTLNLSDAISQGFENGYDPDEVQHAIISLYPEEDLKVLKRQKVGKSQTVFNLAKAVAPAGLPPSFWEEEMRRLALILVPRLTQIALEGAEVGSSKIGVGFNWSIYSLLAEQWAKEYTDALLKQVRTTNEEVVGGLLAAWISTPGRTVGDLRMALAPWFGINRADMIAVTETTRALAAGELLSYQRAGIEEIQWGTNHDELVCPRCGPLNGQINKIGDPFGYFVWRKGQAPEPVFTPPFHPRCRCGISPVVRLRRSAFALIPNSLIVANVLAMIKPAYDLTKGDFDGHPFRGNQWTEGQVIKSDDEKARQDLYYEVKGSSIFKDLNGYDKESPSLDDGDNKVASSQEILSAVRDLTNDVYVKRSQSGEIIGAASYYLDGDTMVINHMGSKQKGVGRSMVNSIIDIAKEEGAATIRADARVGARSFWDHIGFKLRGNSANSYEMKLWDEVNPDKTV